MCEGSHQQKEQCKSRKIETCKWQCMELALCISECGYIHFKEEQRNCRQHKEDTPETQDTAAGYKETGTCISTAVTLSKPDRYDRRDQDQDGSDDPADRRLYIFGDTYHFRLRCHVSRGIHTLLLRLAIHALLRLTVHALLRLAVHPLLRLAVHSLLRLAIHIRLALRLHSRLALRLHSRLTLRLHSRLTLRLHSRLILHLLCLLTQRSPTGATEHRSIRKRSSTIRTIHNQTLLFTLSSTFNGYYWFPAVLQTAKR